MRFMNLIMLFDFYTDPKHPKEASYQEWIFFYAYFVYYNLFIAGTGIKS
jgi:hypothetical protein